MKNYFSPDYDTGLLPQELRKLDNLDGLTEVARMAFKTQVDTENIEGWKENANDLSDSTRDEDLQVAVRFTIAKLVARLAYNQKDENLEEMQHGPRQYTYSAENKEDVFKHVRKFVDQPAIYYLP